jgi:two-component system sensor histidine kinase UhpB
LGNFGKIRIDAAPESEISEVWEEMTLQFLILTGFFALVSWLVSWTLDRALRPLDNLAVALTEVGQGRFTAHVPENGPEELLAIYREFNRMALHLKAAEQQNRALTIQLNTVQEEERNDLARDLHDEIGPFLFAVDVDAQIIPQYAARGDAGEVSTRAGAIRQSVAHMQRHLRSILSRLRPALLLDLGLAQAIDHLVSFWKKRQPGIEIVANVTRASYGASIDEIAFRTIQEALNNAVRHAKPAHIEIKVFMIGDTTLHVSIRDDGSGLAPNAPAGFGLAGMRERISAAGGALEVASNRDKPGVTVVAQLPLGGVPAISNSTEERRTSSP